jgi:hypothetical protein
MRARLCTLRSCPFGRLKSTRQAHCVRRKVVFGVENATRAFCMSGRTGRIIEHTQNSFAKRCRIVGYLKGARMGDPLAPF